MARTLLAVLAVVAVGLPLAASAEAPKKRQLAVLDTKAGSKFDPESVTGLSALIASEAAKRSDLQVIAGGEIRAMVGFEKQRQLLGCQDDSCLAEIGGALGVDFLLASELSTFGGAHLLTLAVVDIGKSRSLKRITRQAETEREVLAVAPAAVAEALAILPVAGGPAPEAAVTAAPAAPPQHGSSALGWTALGVGVAAAAVGGYFYGSAWSQAADPLTATEAKGMDRDAAVGVGLLAGGGALALGSLLLFP